MPTLPRGVKKGEYERERGHGLLRSIHPWPGKWTARLVDIDAFRTSLSIMKEDAWPPATCTASGSPLLNEM